MKSIQKILIRISNIVFEFQTLLQGFATARLNTSEEITSRKRLKFALACNIQQMRVFSYNLFLPDTQCSFPLFMVLLATWAKSSK